MSTNSQLPNSPDGVDITPSGGSRMNFLLKTSQGGISKFILKPPDGGMSTPSGEAGSRELVEKGGTMPLKHVL